MAIEGNSPEQRNLSVTSLAFIAYYIAGGQFRGDEEVTLVLVNLTFDRPEVLGVMAWVMLFWFLYRYWVVTNGQFRPELLEELQGFAQHRLLRGYVEEVIKAQHPNVTSLHSFTRTARDPYFKDNPLNFIAHVQGIDTDGNPVALGNINVNFDDDLGKRIKRQLLLRVFFYRPSFSTHIIPYILFAVALIYGSGQKVVDLIGAILGY